MTERARLLADEDVRGPVLRGIRRHHRDIDVIDVRDVRLEGAPDDQVLDWAAENGRVVVSQDEETMIGAACARIARGLPMPGLTLAPLRCPTGRAIRDIAALVDRSIDDPLDGTVRHLPLDKSWRVSEEAPEWTVDPLRATRRGYSVPAAALSSRRFSTSDRM
jgi:hypothetical protein